MLNNLSCRNSFLSLYSDPVSWVWASAVDSPDFRKLDPVGSWNWAPSCMITDRAAFQAEMDLGFYFFYWDLFSFLIKKLNQIRRLPLFCLTGKSHALTRVSWFHDKGSQAHSGEGLHITRDPRHFLSFPVSVPWKKMFLAFISGRVSQWSSTIL